MINLVIADDENIIRKGLKLMLEQNNEIKVVGCVENALQALGLCQNMQVDIVLMDIVMPVCDGIEGTRLVKEYNPSIKVLILTTFYDEDKIVGALSNGADGYVLKDIEPEELISAVENSIKGLKIMHQNIFDSVVKQISRQPISGTMKYEKDYKVTPVEAEIIRSIIKGNSNKEISSIVNLSEGRVANIITELLEKFMLKNRAHLAAFAIIKKLV